MGKMSKILDEHGFYPIYQTAPGPSYMSAVPRFKTKNPIVEGDLFQVKYNGMTITFKLDMNFYSDPNFAIVKVVEVGT